MILACGAFSLMFALVKALGPEFPHFEGIFFRGLFSLPLVIGLVRREGSRLWPRRPGLMAARGLLGFIAMSSYFYAVQRGKLADMAAISRTQPIFVACLAPLLIGEPAPRVLILTLALGFGGTMLVIKPGLGVLNFPGLTALVAAVFSALAHLCVRRLNATEPPPRIVFYFTLAMCVGGGLMCIPDFVLPSLRQLLLLIVLAQGAAVGQLLMTTAYSRDSAQVVAAAAYVIVVFALLIGLVFWQEIPDALALLGAVLITAAGVVLAYRDRIRPTS